MLVPGSGGRRKISLQSSVVLVDNKVSLENISLPEEVQVLAVEGMREY